MPTQDLNRIAETAEAARRVGEKAKETWARTQCLSRRLRRSGPAHRSAQTILQLRGRDALHHRHVQGTPFQAVKPEPPHHLFHHLGQDERGPP